MPSQGSHIELSLVLARLSAHLDKVAEQVHEVEAELGTLLSVRQSEIHKSISKIQLLDFVRQSLEDCALLTHFLSTSAAFNNLDNETARTLSAKLKLSATQDLLTRDHKDYQKASRENYGIIDFF